MHLRDPIVVGGITAAAANAGDQLRIVSGHAPSASDATEITLAIESLSLGDVGRLPLTLAVPTIRGGLSAGTAVEAKTMGTLVVHDGRLALHIPAPFRLSDDPPHTDWDADSLEDGGGLPSGEPRADALAAIAVRYADARPENDDLSVSDRSSPMNRRLAIALGALMMAAPLHAWGADAPQAPLTASESRFVAQIQRALPQRFATTAQAEAAGYHRFTVEDSSGAISYANLQWTSTDPNVPAQLWYDASGRLIGADYSEPATVDSKPVSILGISPARFHRVGAHIHYVLRNADGSLTYSKSIGVEAYAAATGSDGMHPTAEGLVKAGRATSAAQVAYVFLYPAIWDASVWVAPNPNGAFADLNPNVKPTANAQKDAD